MNDEQTVMPLEKIVQHIHLIRGQKVMLDRDLATLYGVETRALNQAVRRNIDRFPEDFMFSLSRDEIMRISQVVTSSEIKFSKGVLAFTEQGVAMLSSVLRSPRAVRVNIEIMRAFVRLRRMLASNAALARRLDGLERKYDAQFRVVFEALRKLMAPPSEPPKPAIGFQVHEDGVPYKPTRRKRRT